MDRRESKDPMTCPCCERLAKAYKRTVTSTLARWMIALVRRFEREPRWYATREAWSLAINCGTGDIGKLRYWDLATLCPKDPRDTKRRTSGLWQPTTLGVDYVHRRATIARHAIEYDAQCLRLEGPQRDIVDALRTHFNYEALMRGEL